MRGPGWGCMAERALWDSGLRFTSLSAHEPTRQLNVEQLTQFQSVDGLKGNKPEFKKDLMEDILSPRPSHFHLHVSVKTGLLC